MHKVLRQSIANNIANCATSYHGIIGVLSSPENKTPLDGESERIFLALDVGGEVHGVVVQVYCDHQTDEALLKEVEDRQYRQTEFQIIRNFFKAPAAPAHPDDHEHAPADADDGGEQSHAEVVELPPPPPPAAS